MSSTSRAALDAVFDAAARSVALAMPFAVPSPQCRCQCRCQPVARAVASPVTSPVGTSPLAFTSRIHQSHSPVTFAGCSSRASLLRAALCLFSLLLSSLPFPILHLCALCRVCMELMRLCPPVCARCASSGDFVCKSRCFGPNYKLIPARTKGSVRVSKQDTNWRTTSYVEALLPSVTKPPP
jgi:hypothetical protein